MDEKKQNDMDEQIEAENSEVSCSSCPIDSVATESIGQELHETSEFSASICSSISFCFFSSMCS